MQSWDSQMIDGVFPTKAKDIEMAFNSMPNKDGGYCPRCDTVWASPGKCRCEEIKEHAGVLMKDFNIIWNEAIEAAAKEIESKSHICLPLIIRVRGLKK